MNIRFNWTLVIGATFLAMIVGCVSSSPPRELLQRNDHAGLAAWYQQEARDPHKRAEEMHKLAKEYEIETPKQGQTSILVEHSKNLEEKYTHAAEAAEALAKFHAEQAKNP
ncbi:MAG: hypothetical protein ABI618_08060 [Nitrospirota bacterium]